MITEQQDIPKRVQEKQEPWTVKRLFPFAVVSKTFERVVINLYDVLLGYIVFIISIVELIGRHVSWFFWVFTALILLISLFERHVKPDVQGKLEDKK